MNSLFIISLVLSLHKSFCVSLPNNNNSVNWSCLTNLSCINVVIDQVKSGRSMNIGSLKIEKNLNAEDEAEPSSSGVLSFLKNRSLKMPLGTHILDISASKEHKNYLELALLNNDAGTFAFFNNLQLTYYLIDFNFFLLFITERGKIWPKENANVCTCIHGCKPNRLVHVSP